MLSDSNSTGPIEESRNIVVLRGRGVIAGHSLEQFFRTRTIQECPRQLWVKLGASHPLELRKNDFSRQRCTIRPIRSHCVDRVSKHDDSRAQRNALP